MSHQIRGHAKCKLCGRYFYGAIATVLGAAGNPDPELVGYLAQLQDHIKKDHPAEYQTLDFRQMEFLTLLYLLNFTTTDHQLAKQIDFLRWQIHQQTLAKLVTDEEVLKRTAMMAEDLVETCWSMMQQPDFSIEKKPELKAAILRKLRPPFEELRDILQEPGRYQISAVVQPNGPKN